MSRMFPRTTPPAITTALISISLPPGGWAVGGREWWWWWWEPCFCSSEEEDDEDENMLRGQPRHRSWDWAGSCHRFRTWSMTSRTFRSFLYELSALWYAHTRPHKLNLIKSFSFLEGSALNRLSSRSEDGAVIRSEIQEQHLSNLSSVLAGWALDSSDWTQGCVTASEL